MSIEFRCATCGQHLRVPDEAAGKMARCPSCRTEQVVPPAVPGPAPSPEENPYAPPLAMQRPDTAAGREPLVPTPLEVGKCFSAAWNIYLANVGMCIAVYLAGEFISQAPGILIQMAAAVAEEAGAEAAALVLLLSIPLVIASIVLTLWLTAGRISFFVKTARGSSPEFVELFRGWRSVGKLFLLALMFMAVALGAIAVCGIILALFSGMGGKEFGMAVMALFWLASLGLLFYLALRYGMSIYLVVDRDMRVGEALQASAEITRGNLLSLFGLGLLNVLLVFAGYLACCVGIFFTVPLTSMILAVAYLQMSGQTLARTATRG